MQMMIYVESSKISITQKERKWIHYARYGRKSRVRKKYINRLNRSGIYIINSVSLPIQPFYRPYEYGYSRLNNYHPVPWYLSMNYFDLSCGYASDLHFGGAWLESELKSRMSIPGMVD